MAGHNHPKGQGASRKELRESRERVIAALQHHFAHDALDVDEFEQRVTAAHTSESLPELTALVSDLHPLPLPSLSPPPATAAPAGALAPWRSDATTALALPEAERAVASLRGFMSATTRAGSWSVPRRLLVKTLMSATVLDFREALLPPGVVDLEIRGMMSSIEIIVPPGLAVETDGAAFLGSFDDIHRAPRNADPDAPLLRIHGLAVMCAVEIRMRLPGETERQHRQRERERRRQPGRKALPGNPRSP
jgi:hypothetical protein